MKMTKAQLEAELHKATVHLVDMETEHAKLIEEINNRGNELVMQDQAIIALKRQRNDLLEANNRYLERARQAEANLAALGTQTQRLALDTLAYREKGFFARLLWALKGGAP